MLVCLSNGASHDPLDPRHGVWLLSWREQRLFPLLPGAEKRPQLRAARLREATEENWVLEESQGAESNGNVSKYYKEIKALRCLNVNKKPKTNGH